MARERAAQWMSKLCRSWDRGVDSDFRLADEGDELHHLGHISKIGFDSLQRGRKRHPLAIEDPERLTERVNGSRREPGTANADEIQPGHAVVALLEDERRDVLGACSEAAQHRQPANPDALLNRRVAREDAIVSEDDVARDQRVVDHGAAIANLRVMADVAADHEHVPMAHGGQPVPLHGSPVDRHELAEDVVIADLQRLSAHYGNLDAAGSCREPPRAPRNYRCP